MTIEIVDFPINSMVDLSIVMLQITRGYQVVKQPGQNHTTKNQRVVLNTRSRAQNGRMSRALHQLPITCLVEYRSRTKKTLVVVSIIQNKVEHVEMIEITNQLCHCIFICPPLLVLSPCKIIVHSRFTAGYIPEILLVYDLPEYKISEISIFAYSPHL